MVFPYFIPLNIIIKKSYKNKSQIGVLFLRKRYIHEECFMNIRKTKYNQMRELRI